MISWDWKETVSKWDFEKIRNDMLDPDGLIYEMSRDDCQRILQKTNYDFVMKIGFDQVYKIGVEITIKQINKRDGFLLYKTNLDVLKTLISRICNNIKNLFDPRYRESFVAYKDYRDFETIDGLDCDDALTLLIMEEDEEELNILISKMDREYIEFIATVTKLDDDNQMVLNFDNE